MTEPPSGHPREGERRVGDRRLGDRRQPRPRSPSFDTWLSVWGDPQHQEAATEPFSELGSSGSSADSRFMTRQALRSLASDGAALPRILRTYVAARAALGLALVLLPWVAVLLVGARLPLPMLLVSLAYAAQAVSLWLLHGARDPSRQPDYLLPRQWVGTIGVDLVAFTLLRLLDPAPQLNVAALLVLPVLMAGVMTRRIAALATSAVVTLVLLAGVWLGAQDDGDILLQLSQAGLAGAGLFLITLLSSELAQRLAREERSARSSQELVRQQTQLNRVVIEEMTEGVLVVDRGGRLRAVNPAGRSLLGDEARLITPPCAMAGVPVLAGLSRALDEAYVLGHWPDAERQQLLPLASGDRRSVVVRARFTRRSGIGADGMPPEDICVLFLEDLRQVQARQQQDKLAAMGRVSAGIAHEIRNPLAAIAQANALMLEEHLPPAQRQLSRIVADNVARLQRIVDDVMTVAPGAHHTAVAMDAVAEVAQACADWQRTAAPQLRAADRLVLHLPPGPLPVLFDVEHLRRVLVNLLDNAARHATDTAGAVAVALEALPSAPAVRLSVASDGAPVAPEVERHLFEPFFSTRSRGSGLGLYICRELCERHGASIEFRLADSAVRHCNVFSVVMRRAGTAAAA